MGVRSCKNFLNPGSLRGYIHATAFNIDVSGVGRLYDVLATWRFDPQAMRFNSLQVLTMRDERNVLTRAGQLRSEVTARPTCPVNRYAHFRDHSLHAHL
jgi:hypothetical protein